MKNNYRIEKVDSLIYTDEDWKRYYDFQIKCDALGMPMPYTSVEALKKVYLKKSKRYGLERYQVWKNDQVNGVFFFYIEFEDDLEKRLTYFGNQMIDRHLESNLLEMIFQKFIDHDEKSNALTIKSENGMNDYLTDLFSVQPSSTLELYELNVKEVNMEKIDAWLAEASTKFPNLRIVFYKEIPDELLEEFATFFTQMLEDMPVEFKLRSMKITAADLKSKQEAGKLGNYCDYRYLIFNEANQLIGKTNVNVHLKQPQVMNQFMTGVMEKYRGRGLSKWLKAAMFKKLVTDFPELEKIKTETQPQNHASRELSKQMGYKRVGIEKKLFA